MFVFQITYFVPCMLSNLLSDLPTMCLDYDSLLNQEIHAVCLFCHCFMKCNMKWHSVLFLELEWIIWSIFRMQFTNASSKFLKIVGINNCSALELCKITNDACLLCLLLLSSVSVHRMLKWYERQAARRRGCAKTRSPMCVWGQVFAGWVWALLCGWSQQRSRGVDGVQTVVHGSQAAGRSKE